MKAIAEWEPHGIITHSHLSLYQSFLVLRHHSLTRIIVSFVQIFIQNQYKYIPLKVQKTICIFLYASVLFAKKCPMIH